MLLLTVGEVNAHLRELLEADDLLQDVWVQGEVSNFRRAASGHCYFTLKDAGAALDAAMWRAQALRLTTPIKNGDAVLAHGRISIYEASGRVQLYVDLLRPAGVGVLHARFEALKARLEAEGLFDTSRKRRLPVLPRRIGIATSADSAALRDMLTILQRRCPLVEVLIAPCLVQGEQAPASIVKALQQLYGLDTLDVIILGRGGGALEDLWSFNEEVVARAVFASPVPLITGVGHETDTTMVDYVADLRAPTPSAAAELVVPDRAALSQAVAMLREELDIGISMQFAGHRRSLQQLTMSLEQHHPTARIARSRQQLDELLRRASDHVGAALERRRMGLTGLHAQLATLSPTATLKRGYALVRRASDGSLITQAAQVHPGDRLTLTLEQGQVSVEVVATD